MDCREFKNNHVGFVDDLLPLVEMRAMQRHLAHCPRCSRLDTAVRRSLLLVRNLPPVQPSADFVTRLNERLRELGPEARVDAASRWPHLPAWGAFAAVAAGLAAVTYLSIETTRYFA